MMIHGGKVLGCILCGLVLCPGAKGIVADSSSNPYQGIVDRNVFGLKPPPPPPDPEASKPPPPKIFLTGITTIFGNKRALLKTPPAPAKPGETPKGEQYYMLTEGQRDGEMEVLEINEKEGSVRVNYAGTIIPLNFTDNGAKPAPGPAPAPGIPSPTGGIPAPPPAFGQPGMPGGGMKPLPTRTMRFQDGQGGMPGSASMTPVSGAAPGALPMGLAVGGSPVGAQPPQQQAPLDGTTATVMMEVERERLRNSGNPIADLIPPTVLTPSAGNQAVPNPGAATPTSPRLRRAPTLPPALPGGLPMPP